MISREELEALHPTTLAVLCEKLANTCSDAVMVAKCLELKTEWVLLQTPPALSLKEEREKDAKRWNLRRRMVEFLEGHDEVEFYPKRGSTDTK
jgi:hypothetical protein